MHAVEMAVAFAVVRKALDPNKEADFIQIIQQLSRSTQGLAGAEEAAALRKALGELDVDWPNIDAAQRAKILVAAKKTVNPSKLVLPKVEAHLSQQAVKLGAAARKSAVKEHDLKISPALGKTDQQVLTRIGSSQSHFIRDEYGRRSEAFSELARKIVEAGVKRGDGRMQIGKDLEAQLTEQGVNRSRNYWNLIAGTFANRARIFANLSSYSEAGIAYFRFQAVLDERTSAVCRFMHGRRFPVASALKGYADVDDSADPEDVTSIQPWLSSGKDEDGNAMLYYRSGDGGRTPVAHVEDSGEGRLDDTGKFKQVLSDKGLEDAGIMAPPLHGHCRSTIVPDGKATAQSSPKKPLPPVPAPKLPPQALQPAPTPAAPKPSKDKADPVAFGKGFSSAVTDFSRDPTDPDKQLEVREQMRSFISASMGKGVQSSDVMNDEKYPDQNLKPGVFVVKPVADMAGALASHQWNGQVNMRADQQAKLVEAMQKVQANGGDASKVPGADHFMFDAMRTALHEELHGFSKVRSRAYQGVGMGMEEAQTEILARKAARAVLGEKTDHPENAKFWPLPKIGADGKATGGYGSYGKFIGGLMEAVHSMGKVPADRVAKVVEDAVAAGVKGKFIDNPDDHVRRFVKALVKSGAVSDAESDAYRLESLLLSQTRSPLFDAAFQGA